MKLFLPLISVIIVLFSVAANAQKWKYTKTIDDFTDNKKHYASVEGVANRGYITIRCIDETLDIILNNGTFIGGSNAKWRYRVDKGAVFTETGSVSTNSKSLFVRDGEKNTFLQQITRGNKLLLEITDFRDVSRSTTFRLTNSTKAITPVLAACYFDLDPVPSFQ